MNSSSIIDSLSKRQLEFFASLFRRVHTFQGMDDLLYVGNEFIAADDARAPESMFLGTDPTANRILTFLKEELEETKKALALDPDNQWFEAQVRQLEYIIHAIENDCLDND